MLPAELLHNALVVLGQHLVEVHLERMFTKKKHLDLICNFSEMINADHIKSLAICDTNLEEAVQQKLLSQLADPESFGQLKSITLAGKVGSDKHKETELSTLT